MNTITQLQEKIDALQEQLLTLTKEMDAKGASKKSLLSKDCVISRRCGMKPPVQPLELDEYGTLRFKENSIVTYLLDKGGISMNDLARKGFCEEDREQFAQLIGYSLHGFSTLTYASEEVCKSALEEYEELLGESK